MLWRRVDLPGHDSARLLARDSGCDLVGTAVFGHENQPCRLAYVIVCDEKWRTVSATIAGWIGQRTIDLDIVVDSARRWRRNGIDCPEVAGCLDIDLAFSPSTNLLPIRRLNLPVGEAAQVRAAWLQFPNLTLKPLDQVYRRVDSTTYRYESDGGAFAATLRTNEAGFVTSYPDRWEAIGSGQPS
jgi:uncharacterized protein